MYGTLIFLFNPIIGIRKGTFIPLSFLDQSLSDDFFFKLFLEVKIDVN